MNGKQLKNSILQLAIQGKLVPQDPNDEPASELLKRIRAEKERLVKEGKLKKKDLVTTPISDEEKPFEVPEGWEWCRMGEILYQTNAGKSPNCLNRSRKEGEWGVIKTTAVQDGYFLAEENKVLPEGFIVQKEQIVQHEDLLITRAGPRNRTGIVCVVNTACDNLILSDKTVRMAYIRGLINPYYLMYSLNSPTVHGMVEEAMVGMASSQVNISQDSMKEFKIPLPPLAEQHRIVAKIEELMPLVEEYDKAQTKLDDLNGKLPEALKKSILQEAIMGKLVPQDANDEPASELLKRIRAEKEQLVKDGKLKKKDLVTTTISDEEKPFEVPESWEWCRLGEIVVLLSGQDLTPNRYFDSEKGIPYITGASHFVNGSLKVSRWTDSPTSVSHLGDLLITCKGTVGTMAYNTIGDIHIARQIMAITPILTFLPYVQHYLCNIVPKLEKQAHSIIPGISREVLLSSIIPLPPLAEQHRIVAKIDELMQEIDKLR